jgi:hypothetical protein
MLGLGGSGHSDRAERLDRGLSGEPIPADPDLTSLFMAASALRPKQAISQSARARALSAMLREADRVGRETPAESAEDTTDPGIHLRVASAGPNLRVRVADIEGIDDRRLEQIAERLASRLGQRAPDRNQ